MADVYVLLGIVGNVTAMVMFLSPTLKIRRKDTHFSLFLVSRPTFWRIINSRDTGSFSPVPYACTLLNCLLWFFYGLPAVTSNNTLIVTINAAGIILECIYLIVFFTFAPATHRGYLSMLLVGVAGFFAAAIAVTLTAFQQEQRAKFVGAVCVVVGTLMYASPLSVMKLVIATRSVEYMPFSLSLCSLINALLWTSYGVLKHDKFLIVS
ncbi:putative bidirectional sugar transporter SWEET7d [Selaginella moellendorffii]|uniref:putative bidirectional sugar transporter SWEET7d n=1 Tax=Selaginella moellendorffii TaxID=88036 RepID=UPI000D1CC8E2|nr:putative bidirectional sugar transporter SWEET7d [Selaginella moellendorffii]|eukprot:XP_024533218.1 putative bidirectional sugar transporter SWEET7d [Selaginella moellendorffii]